MVKPVKSTTGAESEAVSKGAKISYDKADAMVRLVNADFAIVYDVAGNKVMSVEASEFSVASLDHGIYVVRAGNASRKIAR